MIGRSVIRSRLVNNWKSPFVGRRNLWFVHRTKLWNRTDLLKSVSSSFRVGQLFGISVLLGTTGVLIGTFFFVSVKGVVSLGAILGMVRYISLRMRLLTIQMRSRLISCLHWKYSINLTCSLRIRRRMVLKSSIEENRMLYPVKAVLSSCIWV